jgi:hypothetical protein
VAKGACLEMRRLSYVIWIIPDGQSEKKVLHQKELEREWKMNC